MRCAVVVLLLLATGACIEGGDLLAPRRLSRPAIHITVEGGNAATSARARVVQSTQEWSGLTRVNPDSRQWFAADEFGRIAIRALDLAAAEVGFPLDVDGRAVISARSDEDEADVLVELDNAAGLPGGERLSVHLTYQYPIGIVVISAGP